MQADRLENQMRGLLEIQEGIDLRLEQRDEELQQFRSQSQSDGAQLAALSLQLQELISSVESRAEVVGKDLEEINGWFDRHRGKINRLKIREKDAKEETVRKLDLSHLCFSLNFYFPMFLRLFPSMFLLLTYSQSFFSLIC